MILDLKRAYTSPNDNPHNPQRPIKGVYLQEILFLNVVLTGTEKILLALIDEINVGEGCSETDNQLSYFMKLPPQKIKKIIHNLKINNYLISIPMNKIIVNWNTLYAEYMQK